MKTDNQKSSSVIPAVTPPRVEAGNEACVTRFELAELLHVSVRTVDRMIAAGEIPVRRVRGYAVRFLRSDVEQYLSEARSAECGTRSVNQKQKAESACRTGQ